MSKRFLVRLYPRAWRERYGEEFGLLLDAAPLSARTVANICTAAAKEWVVRTVTGRLILGPSIAYGAMLVAQVLTVIVPAEPALSYDGAVRVSPPWPVLLGIIQPLVQFGVVARFVRSFKSGSRVDGQELVWWVIAIGVAAVCWQWGQMVSHRGTGLEPNSLLYCWSMSVVFATSALMFVPWIAPKPAKRPLGLQ